MRAAFDPDERAALDEIVTGARVEAGAAEVRAQLPGRCGFKSRCRENGKA